MNSASLCSLPYFPWAVEPDESCFSWILDPRGSSSPAAFPQLSSGAPTGLSWPRWAIRVQAHWHVHPPPQGRQQASHDQGEPLGYRLTGMCPFLRISCLFFLLRTRQFLCTYSLATSSSSFTSKPSKSTFAVPTQLVLPRAHYLLSVPYCTLYCGN